MTDIHRQKTVPYLNAIKGLIMENADLATKQLNKQDAKGTPYEGKKGIFDTSTSKDEYEGRLKEAFLDANKSKEDLVNPKINENPTYADIYKFIKNNEGMEPKDKSDAIRGITIESLANEYLSRSPEIRDKTLIVTNAHNDRDLIHNDIRSGLIKEGVLKTDKAISVDRLRHKNLTESQLRELQYMKTVYKDGEAVQKTIMRYKKGMVFQQGNDKFSIVKETSLKDRSVTLVDTQTKQESTIYPAKLNHKFNALYEVHNDSIAIGEKLMLRSDDKNANIKKNDRVEVTDIKDGMIYAKNNDKEIKLNPANSKHMIMEYGYTNTSYSSQGMTVDSVLTYTKSFSPLSTYKSWYVQLSRGREHAMMFTDSLENSIKHIKSTDKSIAHSVIEQLKSVSRESLSIEEIQKTEKMEGSAKEKPANKPIQKTPTKTLDSGQKRQTSPVVNNELNPKASAKPKFTKEVNPRYQDVAGKFDVRLYGKDVANHLNSNAEIVAKYILGEPNKAHSTPEAIAYGSKEGSLKVTIKGKHQGKWKDWSTNERGDMLTLIIKEKGLGYADAVKEAEKLISMPEKFTMKEIKPTQKKIDEPKQESKASLYGKKIWGESQPIKGTIAEQYLKNRGIKNTENTNLRFHNSVHSYEAKDNYAPALVSSFKDKYGKVKLVEVVYLNEKGSKAGFKTGKKTYGSKTRYAMELNNKVDKNSNISYIAEGSITALSIREIADNDQILAVGGKENFKNINPENLKDNVIICGDNDGKELLDKPLKDTISNLEKAGKNVQIIFPNSIDDKSKVDFNDTLNKQNGEQEIKKLIEKTTKDMSSYDDIVKEIKAVIESKNIANIDDLKTEISKNDELQASIKSDVLNREINNLIDNDIKFKSQDISKPIEINR